MFDFTDYFKKFAHIKIIAFFRLCVIQILVIFRTSHTKQTCKLVIRDNNRIIYEWINTSTSVDFPELVSELWKAKYLMSFLMTTIISDGMGMQTVDLTLFAS